MYFIFLTFCYLNTQPISSYVLLAANMEDFRSLAKRFIPDSIADQFISMATKPSLRMTKLDESKENDDPSTSQTEEEVVHKHKHAKKVSKHKTHVKNTPNKFELQLDDLVERVKQSLQKDWSLFLTTKGRAKFEANSNQDAYTTAMSPRKDVFTHSYESKKNYNVRPKTKYQVRYIKQSRDESKDHRERERKVGEQRYVESQAQDNYALEPTPSHLSKYLDSERQRSPQPSRFKKFSRQSKKYRIIKEDVRQDVAINQPKHAEEPKNDEEAPIDPAELLKETDIRKLKDSYEDYVTPKKDDIFDAVEPVKHRQHNTKKKEPLNDPLPSQNNNIFIEVDKAINYNYKKPVNDEEETINYNKKKKFNKVKGRPETTKGSRYTAYTAEQEDDYQRTTSELPLETHNEDYTDHPHTTKRLLSYNKEHTTDVEGLDKIRNVGNGPERFVEVHDGSNSEIVVAPSSMYLDQGRQILSPNQAEPQRNKKHQVLQPSLEHDTNIGRQEEFNRNTLADTATEDAFNIFKGIDMLKVKDSYEDYVTPRKDDNVYDETEQPKNYDRKESAYMGWLDNLRMPTNIEKMDKKEDRNSDYETINYNKKKKTRYNNKGVNKNNNIQRYGLKNGEASILPLPTDAMIDPYKPTAYAEQIGEVLALNEDELLTRAKDDVKLRAERFILEEKIKEGKYTLDELMNKYLR